MRPRNCSNLLLASDLNPNQEFQLLYCVVRIMFLFYFVKRRWIVHLVGQVMIGVFSCNYL